LYGYTLRSTYRQFIDEMIIKPGKEASENGGVEDVTFDDHVCTVV